MSLAIKFPPHENGNFWPEPGVSVPEGFFWDGATLWYRQETGVLRAAPGNFRWSASGTLLFFLGRQGYEMPDRVLERTQVMVTLQDCEQDLRKASLFLMGILFLVFQIISPLLEGWLSVLSTLPVPAMIQNHLLLSLSLAFLGSQGLLKLWMKIGYRKEQQRLSALPTLVKTEARLTRKDFIFQYFALKKPFLPFRIALRMALSVLGILGVILALVAGSALNDGDYGAFWGMALFQLPAIVWLCYVLYVGYGSAFGTTVPAHRHRAQLLEPPSADDFASPWILLPAGASFQDCATQTKQNAFYLRQLLWGAYPQWQDHLKKHYQALLPKSPKDNHKAVLFSKPKKKTASWALEEIKKFLFRGSREKKIEIFLKNLLIWSLCAVGIMISVALSNIFEGQFPERSESLKMVKKMISGPFADKTQKKTVARLYPRWRVPIVIKSEGVDGPLILSSLERQLSILQHLTGMSFYLISGAENYTITPNMILTYKDLCIISALRASDFLVG